jgi:predicted PurR-regulated permease PerM
MLEERVVRVRPRTVLAILGIIIGVFALLQLVLLSKQVLTWVLIAVFLALALNPFVELLMRRGVRRRGLAIGVTYALLFMAIFAIASAFVPTLVDEVNDFIEAVPGFVDDLTKGRGRLGFLEREYQVVERVQDALGNVEISRVLGISGTAVAVTKSIVTFIVAAITITVLSIFMLLEGPRLVDRGLALLSEESRPRWQRIGHEIYATVGGYVAGAITIAVLAGITSAIVLSALGVSYAIALALLVTLLDLVPLAGATVATVIVSVVAFLDQGLTIGLIVLGIFVLYQQLENHVLYPLVYSRTVQLSPLAILIAVLIGASLAGILGALAAIPVAGTVQVLLREWMRMRREGTPGVADAPL